MQTHFFRFRPTNALLDLYEELDKQEIYFAHPSELNDPMEGFRNLFWQGDEIVWKNLFKHYLLYYLEATFITLVMGSEFKISMCDPIFNQIPDDLPVAPVREIFKNICIEFFGNKNVSNLISFLDSRSVKVVRDELLHFLRLLHPIVISIVQKELNKLGSVGSGNDPIAKYRVTIEEFLKKYFESDEVRREMLASGEIIATQNELIFDMKQNQQDETIGWIFLKNGFPTYYVDSLEKLVYPNWHAACFVSNPTNLAMWGSYGDGHRGVCLIFSSSSNKEGFPALDLWRVNSWSGSENGVKENYAFVSHQFEEVRYDPEYPEIDFFRSLGSVPVIKLNHYWYAGENGSRSSCSTKIFQNEKEWHQHHWNLFRTGAISKTNDWAHEKEYRLILTSSLQNFDDISTRKLKYKFSDLAGIVFGIKTSKEDKLKILKIIEKKCISEKREKFELYQARFSVPNQKVEIVPLDLLKIHINSQVKSSL